MKKQKSGHFGGGTMIQKGTFLQDYVKYFYSEQCVIATDVTSNKENITHFLFKIPLECNIFHLNVFRVIQLTMNHHWFR